MNLRAFPLLVLLFLGVVMGAGLIGRKPEGVEESRLVGSAWPQLEQVSLPKNQLVVVNVFATWCLPCAKEHPVLMGLAKTAKVKVIGIAWRDKPPNVKTWLSGRGNPYASVAIDEKGDVTVPLGLTGVPETFIVDKRGVIAWNYKSHLTEDIINQTVLPLIEKLQHE